jgi:SAM-dependent methyltransferase
VGVVGTVHDKFGHARRVRILANRLATLIPWGARILDVGCGDGTADRLILDQRPDLHIEGIEVLVRPTTQVPVQPFDGSTIPHPDASFDIVMFADVLHHTANPMILLREAKRVGKMILIKDHFCDGFLARPTLRLMDWVGNAHHGVALPYNYWSKSQWTTAFDQLGLRVGEINETLGLYPLPASWFFERGFHFVARIDRADCPPSKSAPSKRV